MNTRKFPDHSTLGGRIRHVVVLSGLRQREFAEKLPTDPTQFSRWLNDKVVPSYESLVLIHKFAGCDLDWLLTGKEAKKGGGSDADVPLTAPASCLKPSLESDEQTLKTLLSDMMATMRGIVSVQDQMIKVQDKVADIQAEIAATQREIVGLLRDDKDDLSEKKPDKQVGD